MSSAVFYETAKRVVIGLGYSHEIAWQATQRPQDIDETAFLREAAWVVYCCGFREAAVRRCFDFISLCFYDWISSDEIVANRARCVSAAMHVLGNRRKHEAVVRIASRVGSEGFVCFRQNLLQSPVDTLRSLPFMGPVTALHLAKNLGFDVAKPDRHLVRLGALLGFDDVSQMCRTIAAESGDPVRVVDLVLWRYMERKTAGAIDCSHSSVVAQE